MWRLHRYLLRELAQNTALAFLILFGISLLSVLPRLIDRTQGASIYIALTVALLWSMDSIPDLLMISVLLGTVFTYGRATSDNEILAVRASGIHISCVLAPVVLAGLCASILAAVLVNTWLPAVHYAKFRVISDVTMQYLSTLTSSDGRLEFQNVSVAFDPEKNQGGDTLRDVDLFLRRGEDEYFGRAREITLRLDPERKTVRLIFRGFHGHLKKGGTHSTVFMEKFEEERSLREIFARHDRSEGGDKDMRTSQIVAELVRGHHRNELSAWFTLCRRGVESLGPLLMALIAFPIGILVRRGGMMAAVAVSFIPLSVFYTLHVFTRKFVESFQQPVLSWLPVLVMGIGIAVLLRRT